MISRRTSQLICGVAIATIMLFLPRVLSLFYVNMSIEILIFALFAVSFNLLWGYTGLLPFGHGAFFGVGAYAVGLTLSHLSGMPLLLTILIGAFSGFIIAIIVGFFCVRLKDSYFALINLAFQMFLFAVAWKWRAVTGGDDGMGINRSDLNFYGLGSISMMDLSNLYYFTLFIVAFGIFAIYLFLKTPLGNSVQCMRENDIRASFLGYHVFLTKLMAFSISGFFAALAGGLFTFFQEFVGTNSIDINMSMTAVFMVVIGGAGHFLGPVLGAAFYMVFQDQISSLTVHWWLIMGLLFVFIILYLEGGLVSIFQSEKIRVFFKRQVE